MFPPLRRLLEDERQLSGLWTDGRHGAVERRDALPEAAMIMVSWTLRRFNKVVLFTLRLPA